MEIELAMEFNIKLNWSLPATRHPWKRPAALPTISDASSSRILVPSTPRLSLGGMIYSGTTPMLRLVRFPQDGGMEIDDC